jgi:vesicle transport protein SEC22
MPPLLTFVARLSDGLPLVANTAPDVSSGVTQEHKDQAKDILRGLGGTSTSASKMSIDTSNNLIFHYLVRDTLCYLTLTEQSYPKRLAFLYLEEIADAFLESLANDYGDPGWRDAISTTARPYAYIKFDMVIQRRRKEFVDPTSRQNTTKLNQDLADIQSIMKRNINEVLNRGEKLEHVSTISNNLVAESKKFKWGAKKLSWQAMLNQYGPIAAAGLFVVFVLYMKFFW